jgi:hypothetical protein
MARKRNASLEKVKKYSDFLLYEATGGTMGKPLERKADIPNDIEFSDKRSLLESLLKIAQLEAKDKEENDTGEGEFDRIRNEINASSANKHKGNDAGASGGTPESGEPEAEGSDPV